MQEPLGDAADQKAGERVVAPRADDDQVGTLFLGNLGDPVGGAGQALDQLDPRRYTASGQLLGLSLDLDQVLVCLGVLDVGAPRGDALDVVDDDQLGAIPRCKDFASSSARSADSRPPW